MGENFRQQPAEFLEARKRLEEHIIHFGFVKDLATYSQWLWQTDILPVTSHQDFFGISAVEAIYCDTFPLLPQRLAYPELIPPRFHPQCLYHDFDELIARLEEALDWTPSKRFESLAYA